MSGLRYPSTLINGVASARVRAVTVEKTGQELVDRALARIVEAIRPLHAHPRADSSIVKDVVFAAATPNAIAHHLGRTYQGWTAHRIRTNGATFYEQPNVNAGLDATQVTLVASANCTADIEVW